MTRLSLFTVKKSAYFFFLGMGVIQLIIAAVIILKALLSNPEFEFDLQSQFPFFSNSFLFIMLAILQKKQANIFIEWDDVQINYLIPKRITVFSKVSSPKTISFREIEKVNILLNEIVISTNIEEHRIPLEYLKYKDRIKIKERFIEIQKKLGKTLEQSIEN